MGLGKETLNTLSNFIAGNIDSFRAGNVIGRSELVGTGQMSLTYTNLINKHHRDGRLLRVVYSYDTPIAWLVTGGPDDKPMWIVPGTYHSRTTSQHVAAVVGAIQDQRLMYAYRVGE